MGLTSSSISEGGRMGPDHSQFVKEVVAADPVVMFSKTSCPYCHTAKDIFRQLGVAVRVLELDTMEQGRQLQDALGHMTSARTVPRVFIQGQCIGGCSELKALHHSGRLTQLLAEGTAAGQH